MALIAHTVVAVVLIIAYSVVTVTGNDGTPLLGVLVGYLGGAATQLGIERASPTTGGG